MSATNRGSERSDQDFYPTPEPLARACADFLVDRGLILADQTVLDLGCGDGRFLDYVGRRVSIRAVGVDIREQAVQEANARLVNIQRKRLFTTSFFRDGDDPGFVPGRDKGGNKMPPVDWVIGNPPYSVSDECFTHAWAHARCGVALLLRAGWIRAASRRRNHNDMSIPQPAVIGMISPRPSFTEAGTDASEYDLVCWVKGEQPQQTFGLLDWEKPSRRVARVARMMIPGYKCSACGRGVFTNETIVTCSNGHTGLLAPGHPTVEEPQEEENAPRAARPAPQRPQGKVIQTTPPEPLRRHMFHYDDEE